MECEKLKTVYLDVEKGVFLVNGKDMATTTAFSLVFKDGEYGLKITDNKTFLSKVESKKFYLDLFPSEVGEENLTE